MSPHGKSKKEICH